MAEPVQTVRPARFIFEDEFKVEGIMTCDECMDLQPVGTIMRKAVAGHMPEQRTHEFQSLDGRDLSIDLRYNICQRCVVLNDMRRDRKSDKPDPVATSKPAYADMLKKKTPVRRKK